MWTGLGTCRRSFWRIVAAAVLVSAPIDLIVTLAADLATAVADRSDALSVLLWTSGTALSVAGTMLSLVFFAGGQGTEDPHGEGTHGRVRAAGAQPRRADPRTNGVFSAREGIPSVGNITPGGSHDT